MRDLCFSRLGFTIGCDTSFPICYSEKKELAGIDFSIISHRFELVSGQLHPQMFENIDFKKETVIVLTARLGMANRHFGISNCQEENNEVFIRYVWLTPPKGGLAVKGFQKLAIAIKAKEIAKVHLLHAEDAEKKILAKTSLQKCRLEDLYLHAWAQLLAIPDGRRFHKKKCLKTQEFKNLNETDKTIVEEYHKINDALTLVQNTAYKAFGQISTQLKGPLYYQGIYPS